MLRTLRADILTWMQTISVRTWVGVSIVVGCGLAIGLAGQAGTHVSGVSTYVTALGAPWILLAFALGALTRRPALGALAGGAALVIGTEAYYLAKLVGPYSDPSHSAAMGLAWGAASAVCGGAAGAVGGLWRSECSDDVRAIAGALPGALLTGEALLLSREWTAPEARALIAVEFGAGLGLLWFHIGTSRRVLIAAASALALTAAVILGEHFVREAMHSAGWTGP